MPWARYPLLTPLCVVHGFEAGFSDSRGLWRMSSDGLDHPGRACALQVFKYPSVLPSLAHQVDTAHVFLPRQGPQNMSLVNFSSLDYRAAQRTPNNCLQNACTSESFISFGTRQYSADWPLYRHLTSECPQTSDPERSDVFLVPFLFGYMMTSAWERTPVLDPARRRREHHTMIENALAIKKQLPFLNATTAPRHIFLFSCDGQFVNLELHRLMLSSLVVHLGDDLYRSGHQDRGFRRAAYMANSMSVPYRVSQWLPPGSATALAPHKRPTLLAMNVNVRRSSARSEIANTVLKAATALNATRAVSFTSTMVNPERRLL